MNAVDRGWAWWWWRDEWDECEGRDSVCAWPTGRWTGWVWRMLSRTVPLVWLHFSLCSRRLLVAMPLHGTIPRWQWRQCIFVGYL